MLNLQNVPQVYFLFAHSYTCLPYFRVYVERGFSSAQRSFSSSRRSLAFPLAVLLHARQSRAERVSPPGEERRDRRFDVFIETQPAAAATLVSADWSFSLYDSVQ